MSEKSKYRIIEKDVFYIQKKSKIGWRYIRRTNSDRDTTFLIILFSIGLSVMSIIFKEYVFLYISIFLIGVTFFSSIEEKYGASSLRDAEDFVEREISSDKKKIVDNEKKKNAKIHYLDIKTERYDKLKKLKK